MKIYATNTLLLDGHPSRINFDAIRYLENNNIQLIIFPSNMTSILQPYDAHVAHLFKTEMRNYYQHHKALLEGALAEWREGRPYHRGLLVRIILLAWKAVANRFTLKKAFEVTEIAPWNPNVVLEDPRKVRPTTDEDRARPEEVRKMNINNLTLTAHENILKLYRHELQIEDDEYGPIPPLNYAKFKDEVISGNDRTLSRINPYYVTWGDAFYMFNF